MISPGFFRTIKEKFNGLIVQHFEYEPRKAEQWPEAMKKIVRFWSSGFLKLAASKQFFCKLNIKTVVDWNSPEDINQVSSFLEINIAF